jgi:homoaconitase/3-isopropylmalate dehydratase large subunit
MTRRTLFEKIWTAHEVVPETAETPAVLYVDLHLTHEVTSPQAFALLRAHGLPVRRPDRTLATLDHSTPTDTQQVFGGVPIRLESAARQVAELERNAREFGVELFGLGDGRRGIVHVIGPELGLTQPGMTIRSFGTIAATRATSSSPRTTRPPSPSTVKARSRRARARISVTVSRSHIHSFSLSPSL